MSGALYTTETMPELYGIYEVLDGMFLLSFKLKNLYQWEYSLLTEKPKCETYIKRGLFAEAVIL